MSSCCRRRRRGSSSCRSSSSPRPPGAPPTGSARLPFSPPPPPPVAGALPIGLHLVRHTMDMMREARRQPAIFRAMLGISWFWLVGATFLAQVPGYVKNVIRADEHVVTLFLTAFTIG